MLLSKVHSVKCVIDKIRGRLILKRMQLASIIANHINFNCLISNTFKCHDLLPLFFIVRGDGKSSSTVQYCTILPLIIGAPINIPLFTIDSEDKHCRFFPLYRSISLRSKAFIILRDTYWRIKKLSPLVHPQRQHQPPPHHQVSW